MLVAIARLLGNLLRLPFLPLWLLSRLAGRPRGDWLLIRLRPRLAELARRRPFFVRFLPGMVQVLPTPLEALRKVAVHAVGDRRVRGVVVEIPHLLSGWAACAGVRDVMRTLREGGKEVVAYLPQGGGNREAYVASAADRVLIGPQATIMSLGLSTESRYLKPLLDKLGVRAQAIAAGEFKSAAESLTRESMSDPHREQLTALLSAMDRELVSSLASLPRMSEERVRAMFERGYLRGAEAVEAGFAEAVCYEDELATRLAAGGKPKKLVRAARYLAHRDARFFRRLLPRPYIAIVEIHGAIMSQAPGMGRKGVDPGQLATALRLARSDRSAVGVVLHVNSPGGSALASDIIHREVVRLREKKPVIACFADVAASGGYYIAAAADAIVAQPVTLTGSIGVIAVRFDARELFAMLGVRTETVKTAPHADMSSPSRALTDEEHAILARETRGFYEVFVQVVAEGRKRSFGEIEPLARGRVWSGADAKKNGLVDVLGGLEVAVELAKERAAVPEGARRGLEARTVRIRRAEPPTPEPPAAEAALELADDLAPELAELFRLVASGERIMYWAASVPEVR